MSWGEYGGEFLPPIHVLVAVTGVNLVIGCRGAKVWEMWVVCRLAMVLMLRLSMVGQLILYSSAGRALVLRKMLSVVTASAEITGWSSVFVARSFFLRVACMSPPPACGR